MVADIDGFLPDSAFLLDVPATDWKDAIRLAAKDWWRLVSPPTRIRIR